ncbi:MAG: hypothetical protein SNH35_05770 [Rikenellaceae bacterium]
MIVENSIFEVRRHSRLGAVIVAATLSIVAVLYLSLVPCSGFESIVSPSVWGSAVDGWQVAHPVWSSIFLWFLITYLSVKLGQLVSRYDLYGSKSYLTMEFFPMLSVGLAVNVASLRGVLVAMLVTYSLIRYASSYRNANCVGVLLSGSVALGVAVLLYSPAIVLWGVVPFVLVIFERTIREVIVAMVSLLIVPFAYIYSLWVMGGDFGCELSRFVGLIVVDSGYSVWASLSVVAICVVGIVLCLTINSALIISLLENTIKARRRLKIVAIYAVAIAAMLAMPSSDSVVFAIMAIPASILIPITLLSFGRKMSFIIYVLLFGCLVVNMWLG